MSTQDLAGKRAALSDTRRALLERRLRGEAPGTRPRDEITRVAGPGPEHPASYAQERMWFVTRIAPDRPVYNVPVATLVPADVDVPLLERAFTEVVRRHEALRTTFRMDDQGQLLQVVHEPHPVSISVRDERHRVGERFSDGVNALVAEEGSYPFDLERLPLFRVSLLRVSENDYAMVTTAHHIVTDGWAYPLMNREFLECYAAWREGREPELPPVRLRYADFAVWQREQMRGENLERQVRYWREQLRGAATLELPLDRPRPPVATHRGAMHRFRIGGAVADRLRALCRSEAATLNMVLLAGFYALLRRWTGQDDLVVGTLLGNRPRQEMEDIVGVFVNTAALRVRLEGGHTFRDAIARAKRVVLEADQYQDLPFERLVEELGVPRDLSRNPLFQVLYFHHVYAHSHAALGEGVEPPFEMRPVHPDHDADLIDTGVAKFDLTMATVETQSGLGGVFEYSVDLFDAATMERMSRHFALLLDAASRDPDAPLESHPLATEEELRMLLADWGTGPAAEIDPQPVHRRFEARAASTPDAVAVVSGGERISYGELDAWADRVAGERRARGAAPGGIVAVRVERSAAMVAALLGVLKTGAAYLGLDPAYPPGRIAFMLRDAGAALLLGDAGGLAESASVAVLPVPPRPAPGEAVEGVSAEVGPRDRAYLIYTSGSTGRPKAVEVEHRNLAHLLASVAPAPGIRADDVVLAVSSIAFDASVFDLFATLAAGGRVVVAGADEVVDGPALARLIDGEGATLMFATPATWRMLLQSDWRGAPRLRALVGGEALPAELLDALRARAGEVWVMYGPTETTVFATTVRVDEARPGTAPLGRPMANVRAAVLDERLRPVPVGVPGELYVGGPGVACGYLGRPELTAERFVAHPLAGAEARMYRTGDRARWLPDGTLAFMGRLDGQVKLRGFRIELGEVEAELMRHPGVSAAAAVVRQDGPGEPRLVAYVAGRNGQAPGGAELRTLLRERLPDYMVPGAFVRMDALPLTSGGKVDRRALPAPDPETGEAQELVEPRNVVEDMLAEMWAEVLHRQRIGVTENFFAIGGHSLLAMQVIVRIRDTFEVEMPIRTFFVEPTIEGLAAVIESSGSSVLARMMDEVESLSAEEIDALLNA